VGQSLAGTFGTLLGVGVCVVPVVVAIGLTSSAATAVRIPVLLAGAAGYGIVLAWAGQRIAASAAESKLPELYQVAIRSTL
jgi:ABC-2 type transport system permease protein